jgi:Na+/H+-dicarboxylate symporter
MCMEALSRRSAYRSFLFYSAAISLGIFSGLSDFPWLADLGIAISDVFIKIFKCISLPLIGTSLLVTITGYQSTSTMRKIGQKSLIYTFGTTLLAASLTCILYIIINPSLTTNIEASKPAIAAGAANNQSYLHHLSSLIPENFLEPFIEHKVMGALLIAISLGFAIRGISNNKHRALLTDFFQGLHSALMFLSKKIILLLPLALYGFITVTSLEFKKGLDLAGVGEYLAIVVLANIIQGLVILPLWLKWHRVAPFKLMRGALPALSMAFFSKSSTASLSTTLHYAEHRLGIKPSIAKFVLPLCTTINMNGCAAFIFATVLYLSQSHGLEFSAFSMVGWIFIASIAAIGNAGVPMGCFFLSASLLSTMEVPLTLLGVILPFYSLIDMLETSLNVWSDICVTKVIDQHPELVILDDLPNTDASA